MNLLHCLEIAITCEGTLSLRTARVPGMGLPNVRVEWSVLGSTSPVLSQSKQELGHLCHIASAYDSLLSMTGAE